MCMLKELCITLLCEYVTTALGDISFLKTQALKAHYIQNVKLFQ